MAGGCAVTAHPLDTKVAGDVLADGGNAVDAAVAAAFALAVVEPYSSGLGGGGFFLVHDAATGSQSALDARETAPSGARRDMFMVDGAADPDLSRDGALSVAVPALVRGLEELHRRHGRLEWSRLVADAVELAAEGFPADSLLVRAVAEEQDRLDQAARAVFMPEGRVPVQGEIIVQRDLAVTLAAIRDGGATAFHEGPVAEALATAVTSTGGLLTVDDLATIRPVWRDPILGRFGGRTIVGMPPPSSGGILLQQMLDMVGGWDLGAMGEADRTHLLAHAMAFAFADRSLWIGDPDHVEVPIAMLLDEARTDSLRALVDPDRVVERRVGDRRGAPKESDDTTHLSIIDADGNAVAATLTINLSFGSGMMAEGTGVVLNDEMDDFSAAPGTPNAFGLVGGEANAVASGKRPLSSMTPTIVLEDGDVRVVAGSPGGSRIITATLQCLVNVLVLDMHPAEAVARPRVHHQWLPAALYHEPDALAPAVRASLAARGHELRERKKVGNVQMIVVDPVTRTPVGAPDPRGLGAAVFVSRGDASP